MSVKKYDVIVSGYLGIDLIPGFKKNRFYKNIHEVFNPGKLTEIGSLQITLGGVVANTGMALKRFGNAVVLNGIIGDDFMGRVILEKLQEYCIADGVAVIAGASTAFGIVIAPPGVDRIFFESPGCNETFSLNDINFQHISQSRIFHFGYPPLLKQFYVNDGAGLIDLFGSVKRMGVITSLDLSLPDSSAASGSCDWPGIMQQLLPLTDIFAPSAEELLYMMAPGEYQKILVETGEGDMIDFIPLTTIRKLGEEIIAMGVSILLIKLAHRGVYLITGDVAAVNRNGQLGLSEKLWSDIELHCDAFPADMKRFKNASGAGDTAVAAFLSALLVGYDPVATLNYTSLAGRNNLYSDDIYLELDGWQRMTEEIASDETDRITDLRSLNRPIN